MLRGGAGSPDRARRRRRHPLRRTGRRTRHAGDAQRHRGARRRGSRRRRRPYHGWALLRRHARADARSYRPGSSARWADRDRPGGRRDRHRCRPEAAPPGGPRRGDRTPSRGMDAPPTELHDRRAGQICGPGRIGLDRGRHDRTTYDREPGGCPRPCMTRHIPIGIKTSPQAVDWATLDAMWARIGTYDVFESFWINDHLTDISFDRHGPSLEALTTAAALLRHVPGRWIGHAVLSNTFRHPAVLAKAATVLDHATGGRFIVGLGAGWHEGEHVSLGI